MTTDADRWWEAYLSTLGANLETPAHEADDALAEYRKRWPGAQDDDALRVNPGRSGEEVVRLQRALAEQRGRADGLEGRLISMTEARDYYSKHRRGAETERDEASRAKAAGFEVEP